MKKLQMRQMTLSHRVCLEELGRTSGGTKKTPAIVKAMVKNEYRSACRIKRGGIRCFAHSRSRVEVT
jgi:hypothetical protein